MNENIINLSKEDRDNKYITLNNITINLPNFILGSISKYRFIIDDNNSIYLQRKCNKCENFFNVQIIEETELKNIKDSHIRFIGPKSGFHNTCYDCDKLKNTHTKSNNFLYQATDSLVQLNVNVDNNIKKYYQLLSINNGTNLKEEINNALIFYKNHLEDIN